ncbi:MAG: hypothetical protein PT977_03510 [Acidobacteriota bacterium]|nr:hypothetical protein [Acidobacteriota bacterium]
MRKNTLTLSAALLVLSAALGGAAVAQPIPPPPPGMPDLHVRIVPSGPPSERHRDVVIARPGPHHVWVKGGWQHNGESWAWNEGRWLEPPRSHARWVAPRYKSVRGGYQYIPGHWSHERVIYN